MKQDSLEQQLQEQMNKLIRLIQPKPLNCTNHTMNSVKCKNCIYNIGICVICKRQS